MSENKMPPRPTDETIALSAYSSPAGVVVCLQGKRWSFSVSRNGVQFAADSILPAELISSLSDSLELIEGDLITGRCMGTIDQLEQALRTLLAADFNVEAWVKRGTWERVDLDDLAEIPRGLGVPYKGPNLRLVESEES